MSARQIWYPNESIVIELPAAQATDSGAGRDVGTKNSADASNNSTSDGAKLAKGKPKITRRRTPTVDTSNIRNESTSSYEKLDSDPCGRGTTETTYSTIENTGARSSTKTLLSNLMQCDEPAPAKRSDFHGWLDNDPILQWRNIFMPKLEHPTPSKITKDHHRTRKHRSEEFIFQHYKDISEYMNYYRKHCCLTSLSVPSLNQPYQSKPKENSRQDRKLTRPSTQGVFRTINDNSTTENKQGSTRRQNPRFAELENTTGSTSSPSKPLPLVPRPSPASIVNRESTSIILCGSASSSSERYYKDDADGPATQNKETTVKSTTSTAEGVELPPINNCYHSSSDSSFSPLHIRQSQHRHALLTDPLVGAEGELEDHYFHSELTNRSDPTLVASSVSIIQQSNSGTKLDDKDEATTDESWMHPYPHFQVSSSSRYDKITREQLLSSKAHALGLLSSKNWTKNTKASTSDNGDALLTRIRSLPGRIPKELNYMPTLDGVNESLHASNSRINSSKANSVTDTIHNRIQTAAAGTHMGHTRLANQSRPIHTSKGSSKSQHQRATSSTKPQLRNQRVPLASKLSHPKQRLSGIHHSRQLSSGSNISYIGQVSDRLQGILKVKHENSTFIRNSTSSMVAS